MSHSPFDHFSPQERAILQQRAQRIAQEAHESQEVILQDMLIVQAHEQRYALPVQHILMVYDELRLVRVPGTPPFIRGVANVRGQMLSVLDLSVLLGYAADDTAEGHLLILPVGPAQERQQVALFVSAVEGIHQYATENIIALPPELDTLAHALGILPDGIILLNLQAMLNDPRWIVEA